MGVTNPLVVCSSEQLEQFKNDINWEKIPEGSFLPYFQPNEDQMTKIKKLLEGADKYILTESGFEPVD